MTFNTFIVMAWILFLALFPMAFIWLRRAWRIFFRKDYSEVALKGGEPPPHPEKWAWVTGAINLVAGLVALWVIIGVPLWIGTGVLIGPFHNFNGWSAVAGSTIWLKIFADFIVSRQAHPFLLGRKKKSKAKNRS
ncbi:MAG TPA: hypothetical protein VJ910_08175 [Desulfuromonadales bacterium]|nr:hypothetical protein [Desulfuromonadales bacterium]